MPFAPGQRTASLHVAFCPPFARTPEVSAQQLDGPAVRIKTGQLLPYGVRLDLKLSAAAEMPSGVLLRFSARSAGEGDLLARACDVPNRPNCGATVGGRRWTPP